MLLHEDALEALTMVIQGGLYMLTGVPQGVTNATGHFQATMKKNVLDGIVGEEYLVWVGGTSIRGRMPRDFLLNVFKVMRSD